MKDKYMNAKKIIVITMCTLICIMAVGYAAFSTKLTITGTSSIESTWNVEFAKIEEVSKTSGITITNPPTAKGTTATFNVDLTSPGDNIIYRITVANNGTLNAIIDNITASETGSDAIKFEITGIKKGDKLASKATTTFNVKISYDESITTQPKKTNNVLSININYVQDVGQTITSEDIVIDKNSVVKVVSGDINSVGSIIKIGDEQFYIISSDDTKVAALAMYNLDIDVNDTSSTGSTTQEKNPSHAIGNNSYKITPLAGAPASGGESETYKGTGKQDSFLQGTTTYGTLAFATLNYWSCDSNECNIYDSNSKLYKHIESYKTYLESLDARIYNARLITKNEYVSFGCEANGSCANAPSWIYSTSYWSSTSYWENVYAIIYNVGSTVESYSRSNFFGVRPVIEILKSDI